MPRRFATAHACLASLLLTPLGGCDTLNSGGNLPDWGPVLTLGPGPTASMYSAGSNFTWQASWSGGTPPYVVTWQFGPDFDPPSATVSTSAGEDSQVVSLSNFAGASGSISLQVTDASGLTGTGMENYSYGYGETPRVYLTISGGEGTTDITVQADDTSGDDITITATPPVGFTVSGPQTVPSGSAAIFHFIADDLLAGGTGTAYFDGDNGRGGTAQVSAIVTQSPIVLAADTLYAIPLQGSAAAGEPVRIVVATGVPANPFQFMNGCRVTAPTGFTYVANSLNLGNPGGGAGDADGFWAGMNPGGGLTLPPDGFIREFDLGGGQTGISFNVTPLGGSDQTTASGALFMFEATFAAGSNRLGFQEATGAVKRTFYSDGALTEYFWGDISNNHAGVPNSVDVE